MKKNVAALHTRMEQMRGEETNEHSTNDIDELLTVSPQRSGTSTLKDVVLGKMNELLGRNDISDEVKNVMSANKKKLEEVARMFSNEMEVK